MNLCFTSNKRIFSFSSVTSDVKVVEGKPGAFIDSNTAKKYEN